MWIIINILLECGYAWDIVGFGIGFIVVRN